jgi:hypothetical protein
MTQEEKNIKLAELDGWKEIEIVPYREYHLKTYWNVAIGRPPKSISNTIPIPNYFTDLNVVHKLENQLGYIDKGGWELIDKYLKTLYDLAQDPHICHTSHAFLYVTATAEQRCEAIGKALNLW